MTSYDLTKWEHCFAGASRDGSCTIAAQTVPMRATTGDDEGNGIAARASQIAGAVDVDAESDERIAGRARAKRWGLMRSIAAWAAWAPPGIPGRSTRC